MSVAAAARLKLVWNWTGGHLGLQRYVTGHQSWAARIRQLEVLEEPALCRLKLSHEY